MATAKLRERAGKLSSRRTNKREQAVLNEGGIRCDSVLYDFSEDGGAVGTVSFGRKLPAGAVITRCWSTEEETVAEAAPTATVQFKAGSTDITAALNAVDGNPVEEHPVTLSKLAEASELQMEIGAQALTAGKIRWYVEYLIAND